MPLRNAKATVLDEWTVGWDDDAKKTSLVARDVVIQSAASNQQLYFAGLVANREVGAPIHYSLRNN